MCKHTWNTRRHISLVQTSTTVATVLTPIERVRVDVAAQGAYSTLHRASVDDVVHDLREQRAEAVFLSVLKYDSSSKAHMSAMVREFPRIPTFALLSDVHKSTPQSVHALGQIGVRTLVDVRYPSGWSILRERLMEEQANSVQRLALGMISSDLIDASLDCWQFFELLFSHRPHVASIRQIGRHMNVLPTTLISRFYRARLPSPKRYIDFGRLIRAARLLENVGLSVTTVARQMDYSSPQAFSRHVRCMCGMSPVKFRQLFNGEAMLQHFREELILPYVDVLRTFHPVAVTPSWIPKTSILPSR